MLNGDAHHSLEADGELRIRPLLFFKDSNARMIAKSALSSYPFAISHRRREKTLSQRPAVILYVEQNRMLLETVRDVLEFAGLHSPVRSRRTLDARRLRV